MPKLAKTKHRKENKENQETLEMKTGKNLKDSMCVLLVTDLYLDLDNLHVGLQGHLAQRCSSRTCMIGCDRMWGLYVPDPRGSRWVY